MSETENLRALSDLRHNPSSGPQREPIPIPMDTQRTTRDGNLTNRVLLSIIAAMLGVLVLDRVDQRAATGLGSVAHASSTHTELQPEPAGALVSAAEQRKQIIVEIRSLSARIESLDQKLRKPLPVKVVEMPVQKEKPVPAPGN